MAAASFVQHLNNSLRHAPYATCCAVNLMKNSGFPAARHPGISWRTCGGRLQECLLLYSLRTKPPWHVLGTCFAKWSSDERGWCSVTVQLLDDHWSPLSHDFILRSSGNIRPTFVQFIFNVVVTLKIIIYIFNKILSRVSCGTTVDIYDKIWSRCFLYISYVLFHWLIDHF